MKKIIVYIDSFNLYYGILNKKEKGLKWLNIESWIKKLFPEDRYSIVKIKYFTALVFASDSDEGKPIRQNTYFRALQTSSKLELILGRFITKEVKINLSKETKIITKTKEEKGTDVNIGVYALHDAHLGLFDTAVLVSNDSDLASVVKFIAKDIGKEVIIVNPCEGNSFSSQLNMHATSVRRVRRGQIESSQFPLEIRSGGKIIKKPLSW